MATFVRVLSALALGVAGCQAPDVTDEEHIAAVCESALESLESCGTSVPPDFLHSCQATETQEELDALLMVADTTCEADPGKADAANVEFPLVCAAAVQAAAVVMKFRNYNQGVALSEEDLALFRQQFEHVDGVEFYFGAGLLDEWTISGYDVQLGFDIGGQTFGDRVYIEDEYAPGSWSQRKLLAHELQHTQQVVDRGGSLFLFAVDYCRAFVYSGLSYENNVFELDANLIEDRFADEHL